MVKILLLGDGPHDRGDETGKAGTPMPSYKWGALQFFVKRALQDGGVAEADIEFVFPLPAAVALREGSGRKSLPPDQVYLKQIRFFMKEALLPAPQLGLVVIIKDQDCDLARLERLRDHMNRAYAGLQGPPWIAAVSIECTENWLLCREWPPKSSHAECSGLTHPRELGCTGGKNRAKGVFTALYGPGLEPRRKAAEHITRHPEAAAWIRLRQAEDFRELYDELIEAAATYLPKD